MVGPLVDVTAAWVAEVVVLVVAFRLVVLAASLFINTIAEMSVES